MWGIDKAKELTNKLFTSGGPVTSLLIEDPETNKNLQEQFQGEIIAYVTEQFTKRQNDRSYLELQWRLNINFYNGQQFTCIDPVANDILEMPLLTEWEERNVFNEIAPNIETRFAILSKRKNNLKNRPASTSSQDRTSAKIGNKVLASTKRRLEMSDLQQEANLVAGITGTAVWKTIWNPSLGRKVGIREDKITEEETLKLALYQYENELLGLKKDVVYKEIREGDVSTTLHSPFEIYPENIAVPLRKQRRIMHVALMTTEEVFNKWGIIEEGQEENTYKVMASQDRNYGSGITGHTCGQVYSSIKINNVVKVYEEWELPSPRYPQGRLIICTDNNLMYYGALPEPLGENGQYILPFDVQQSLKSDGFFGSSVVGRLIPLQINYNAVKNRKQDYINRVAIGVLSAEDGTLIDEDYLRENGIAPGDILLRQRGSNSPQFLNMPDLPDDVSQEEDRLLAAIDRLSGISQLAKQSIVPSNITSGLAISELQEQDDTRIGLEAENIKNTLCSVGRKWLILYRNNVKYPRMAKDIGRDDEFEISQFIGSDLNSFDVFIEAEPEASDTLSQRRQRVIELLNSGLFNDTETGNITNEGRVKIFEMLELGDWEYFTESENDQQRKASRENNKIIIGDTPILREFDDDAIHISVHNNFRLKSEYEEALLKDPNIDAMFEEHVSQHLINLQKKTQAGGQSMPVEGTSEQGINNNKIQSKVFTNQG